MSTLRRSAGITAANFRSRRLCALSTALVSALMCTVARPAELSTQALAGRHIFFDVRLSNPQGTACASCHNPQQGWGGNNASKSGVAAGSNPGVLGGRNSPTIGYAGFAPGFHIKKEDGKNKAAGGLFWDGRVDTLEQQASGPLFSRIEMNLAGEADLAERLRTAPYATELRTAFSSMEMVTDAQWTQAAISAVSAFQRSAEVAPFDSKYDAVLRGQAHLTDAETRGFKLFADPKKGNCAACHVFDAGSKNPVDHLFTDFTYDNLGLPRNAAILANDKAAYFDLGLCGPARAAPKGLTANGCGAFKVPTLRNAAKRPFYFHNGSFTDLALVVRFYVERDTNPAKWYPKGRDGKPVLFNDLPKQYARNVNRAEAPYDRKRGQQPRLSDAEIADVVAFIKTLDDGFRQ